MKYMIIFMILWMIPSLIGQDIPKEKGLIDEKEESKEKDKNLGQEGVFTTRTLPNWSISNEVTSIEKSLSKYDPLIASLEEANNDLKNDLAEYLKSPGDQVLGAKITAKMSKYAKKIVGNVDTIVGDQDVLLTVFGDVNQKLEKFNGYMDFKVAELDKQVEKFNAESVDLEKQLKVVAKKWKACENPEEKEKYRQEFRRLYNKYNINSRYKDGFSRNRKDYEVLSGNLKGLVKIFKILNQAFDGLIENLAAERKYLLDNIQLQADAIRVQKLVHEGISDGSKAVVTMTKKLALLYAQVDGFAKVHEKINRDMAKFSDSTKILSSLVQQIEKTPFQSAPTLDKAIEYFANTSD